MFKKFFEKTEKNSDEELILISALLIYAAKIDDNYTSNEKKIIQKALIDFGKIDQNKTDIILKKAEKKEQESNQILEFTREIKKHPMNFRLRIIEIIWKIVYSDGTSDNYEASLIRRICGLLYISDKDNGIVKTKVQKLLKNIK
tara:strand:- start:1553 stop:1984 length:432 start_codon:yes stop_codon:yes gene_type:complete